MYTEGRFISPVLLASKYKLPGDLIAIFADYPTQWKDYLRGALAWNSTGHTFSPVVSTLSDAPGSIERQITETAERLHQKHKYKLLGHRLSVRAQQRYRDAWVRLLQEGAGTWEDFLSFNPLEEAISPGGYYRTRLLRDYLVAYLFGCAGKPEVVASEGTEEGVEEDSLLLEVYDEEEEDGE